jgi:dihydrofolate synthase/folylpolyglutamate synthase
MTTRNAYQKCLQTIYGLQRFGIKMGLGVSRRILKGLGNPQKNYRTVHVAGTNGKGSVASALATILQQAGLKTGLYTSPHLVRFNERILVNQRQITNRAVVAAYERVRRVHSGNREPTFFEFATAMALDEFGRQGVDWAVVETGMGGRLDATNILQPDLSIITNISLEHRDYLGATIAQIAGEKAGIIKKRTPVITGAAQPAARTVIEKRAAELSAPVFRRGRDFRVRRQPGGRFDYFGMDHRWKNLHTGLAGGFQIDNSALVLAGCEVLIRRGVGVNGRHIRNGLLTHRWPGRIETVSTDPLIILDGAHNLAAARNLAAYLKDHFAGRSITLVVGILDDKPYRRMLKSLLPVAERVIFTEAEIGRALPAGRLAEAASGSKTKIEIVGNVPDAVQRALDSLPDHGLICIAGSLYVVGEAKSAFSKGAIKDIK